MLNQKSNFEKWSKFYQTKVNEDFPSWPIEHIVKLFFGNYLKNKISLPKNASVLDVGCGFGNNLLPFLQKGYKCYGTEVTLQITKIAKKVLNERGYNVDIKVGSNRDLPFKDNSFDVLISSGVIHYEGSEKNVKDAIAEYTRVLKPNGILFISTTGPSHDLFIKARKIAKNRYMIRDYDFRNSQVFYFFEKEVNLQKILKKYFKIVETGRIHEKLIKRKIDTLIGVAQIKSLSNN